MSSYTGATNFQNWSGFLCMYSRKLATVEASSTTRTLGLIDEKSPTSVFLIQPLL